MLSDFERRIASIPQDLCEPFHAEARQLVTELMAIYKMVVLCVRQQENLEEVAISWSVMVEICDAFAKQLNNLSEQHPYCGADAYYDRVLDLRNKCERLQQLHS